MPAPTTIPVPEAPARRWRHALLACAVLVAALALAACGARDGDEEEAAQRAVDETTSDADAPDDEAAPGDDAAAPTPAARHPLVEEATVRELAGEVVMTSLGGTTLTAAERRELAAGTIGGIILFGFNVQDERQVTALVQQVQDAAAGREGRPPLLVSVDQEGGDIRTIPFAPPFASQASTAASGPGADARIEQAARRSGEALRALGINMVLGPVADLDAPPNRTMAGRAYGRDAEAVAPLVAAAVDGLQAGGVAATAKHAPGFGASTANSDFDRAFVDRTREQLVEEELVPFAAAVEADVDAIMVSHGLHRRLEGSNGKPGTLDPAVVRGLVREELAFDGVVVTDSMMAVGLRESIDRTIPQACPVSLGSGVDLLLLTGSLESASLCRDRIVDAVVDGQLERRRLEEAAGRVLALRERLAAEGPPE